MKRHLSVVGVAYVLGVGTMLLLSIKANLEPNPIPAITAQDAESAAGPATEIVFAADYAYSSSGDACLAANECRGASYEYYLAAPAATSVIDSSTIVNFVNVFLGNADGTTSTLCQHDGMLIANQSAGGSYANVSTTVVPAFSLSSNSQVLMFNSSAADAVYVAGTNASTIGIASFSSPSDTIQNVRIGSAAQGAKGTFTLVANGGTLALNANSVDLAFSDYGFGYLTNGWKDRLSVICTQIGGISGATHFFGATTNSIGIQDIRILGDNFIINNSGPDRLDFDRRNLQPQESPTEPDSEDQSSSTDE